MEEEKEEEEEEEEGFQPLPVDSWEIPENCIIMLTLLGEGQFGEVYKGMIRGRDMNNPFCKGSGFVAVKILRCELWCVCVRACVMSRNEQDEQKMRREEGVQSASIELRCEKPGCMFVGQTKAGPINHTRHRHDSTAQLQQ